MIRNVVAAFAALAGSAILAATDAAKPLIVFNDDVDVVMRAMKHANATNRCTKEMVEGYYSRIVDGGKVTHLLMNVNSRCSGYPSKVAPSYWAALDEPDMNHPVWVAAMRDLVVGQGVDVFLVGIDKCRAKGVSPWLSFRMNDCHYSFDRKYILNVGFWRDHPELWIDPSSTNRANGAWGERAFDFRKPKVQEYTLAYLREALERYDVDGIELDWLRFSAHAPRKVARTEGAAALTAFTRKAKALVAEQEKRRGHKITIAARVESDPEMALNHSMDWRVWAKEGLVDWLIACNFWDTADFELPLARWTSELKAINPRLLLLPGLDCGIHLPGQGHRNMTVDEYAGWGDRMYGEGAKGIYFFNLFCEPYERHPAKTETWELVTKEGFTPENLAKRKRTVPKNAPRECANGGWYSPIY